MTLKRELCYWGPQGSDRRLKKNVYISGELIQRRGQAAGIDYILDATFHRYGALGPLALVNGAVLDDSGEAAGIIDAGSLTALIDTSGAITLQNQKAEFAVNPAGWSQAYLYETAVLPVVEGDTVEHVYDVYQGLNRWGIGNQVEYGGTYYIEFNLNTSNWLLTLYGNSATALNFMTATNLQKTKIVFGGYNADAEPVPAGQGTQGVLVFVDGVLRYTSALHPFSATGRRSRVNAFSGNILGVTSLRRWIDTTTLGFIARSLFATDHANIAEYAPESGPGWVQYGAGNWHTIGGQMVEDSDPSPQQDRLCMVGLENPASYIEIESSGALSQIEGLVFRGLDEQNYWTAYTYSGYATFEIQEVIGGIGTARASIGSSGLGRTLVSDDGAYITAMRPDGTPAVLTHTSTAGEAATKAGYMRRAGSAMCKWFCVRTER